MSSNETNNTTSVWFFQDFLIDSIDSRFAKIFFGILWSLLATLGILGNGLVIFIAIAHKKLNDITNCYIFNLAITDLLFIVFCIPFTTYLYIHSEWTFGEVFCKLNHFMSHASVQSTCLTLTAMTIHRCRLIIKNKIVVQNQAKIKERQKTVLMITIFIWITSFLISSPDLLYYSVGLTETNGTELMCSLRQDENKISRMYIRTSHFIGIATTYVIPLLIIILSYARLLSHLTQNQKNMAKFTHKMSTGNGERKDLLESNVARRASIGVKQENKKKRVTKMVALVTLNFGICWLPTHLNIIMRSLLQDPAQYYAYLALFKLTAHTLSYLTPVINPCFYAFYNENFRKSLKEIWGQVTCQPASQTNRANKSKNIVVI